MTRRGAITTQAWFGIRHLGLHGRAEATGLEGRTSVATFEMQEAVSLRGSSALRLQGSEPQQRQPTRMALADHHFAEALALTFRTSAAHEAVMVQVELQEIQVRVAEVTPQYEVLRSREGTRC